MIYLVIFVITCILILYTFFYAVIRVASREVEGTIAFIKHELKKRGWKPMEVKYKGDGIFQVRAEKNGEYIGILGNLEDIAEVINERRKNG